MKDAQRSNMLQSISIKLSLTNNGQDHSGGLELHNDGQNWNATLVGISGLLTGLISVLTQQKASNISLKVSAQEVDLTSVF